MKEQVLCDFELFYRKLRDFAPVSESKRMVCAATLRAVAKEHAEQAAERRTFSLSRERMKARAELKKNNSIIITRPDKGRATVIMTRVDYNTKMAAILEDGSKLVKLGPVSTHDRTLAREKELVTYLKNLRPAKDMSESEFFRMKPIGSVRPRMYGLPKIHKPSCPLRPILSMIGSPQYAILKCLCGMIQPVVDYYCKHNVKDTFQFVEILRENPIPPTAHMCSLDVACLFTNVPLDETIDICAQTLYHNDDDVDVPWLPESAFRRLMLMVTSGVEFSFGDVMYKQTDGVAMGLPLGPALANVFVGYCESRMDKVKWPQLYVRFLDDSFTYFESRRDSEAFLTELNDVHPALRFTCEHKESRKLSFWMS